MKQILLNRDDFKDRKVFDKIITTMTGEHIEEITFIEINCWAYEYFASSDVEQELATGSRR